MNAQAYECDKYLYYDGAGLARLTRELDDGLKGVCLGNLLAEIAEDQHTTEVLAHGAASETLLPLRRRARERRNYLAALASYLRSRGGRKVYLVRALALHTDEAAFLIRTKAKPS